MTKGNTRPPRFAERILYKLANPNDEVSVLGDLREEYAEIAVERGLRKARLWYWKHILRSVIPFIFFKLYWSVVMMTTYLKIALRLIKRQKGYAFINITGLAVGLAAFLIISLYILYELSFDRYHQNAGRIFRVAQEFRGHDHAGKNTIAVTPFGLGQRMKEDFPEVISSVRIVRLNDVKFSVAQHGYFESMVLFTDPGFYEMFTFPFIHGEVESALRDPYSIVISERSKVKYFGSGDAIGKTIRVNEEVDLKVTGVMRNMPRNGHFVTDFVIPLEIYGLLQNLELNDWNGGSGYTYVLLSEESHPKELEKKLPALVDKYMMGQGRAERELFLQPLIQIHRNPNLDAELATTTDMKTITLLGAVGFLILTIAGINYMNLATARSEQRGKEVGVRKVIGAQKGQLMRQFFSESVVFTILAFLLSLLLISVVLPTFSAFVDRELHLGDLFNVRFVLWMVGLTLFFGLLAGSYPALYISRIRPISILRTTHLRVTQRLPLRSILVIFQFSISVVLLVCTLVVKNQCRFIQHHDVGYSRNQIVVIRVKDPDIRDNLETIKTELKINPHILAVSSSTYLPNRILDQTTFRWTGKEDDLEVRTYVGFVDYDFVDLYELEIVEGRNFSRDFPSDVGGAFLLNETAVKALEWDSFLGRELIHWDDNTGKIVGILKDFNFHSLHRDIEPLYLYFEPKERNYYLSVKIRGNHIPETIAFLKDYMTQFSSEYPFEYEFFDDIFNQTYRSELRLEQIFTVFASIAIFIGCLGLLGLATFAAEQRTKEIGIRKVFGASVSSIFFLLSMEFVKWVLIANVIAWPVAYFTMNHWLEDFAYRTNLGLDTFVVSAFVVVIIAIWTISYQAIRAARANPVETLRYE